MGSEMCIRDRPMGRLGTLSAVPSSDWIGAGDAWTLSIGMGGGDGWTSVDRKMIIKDYYHNVHSADVYCVAGGIWVVLSQKTEI